MNDLKPKSAKKERKTYTNQNFFESFAELGKGVKNSIVDELGKGGAQTATEQVFGKKANQEGGHGDLEPGQELDFTEASERLEVITEAGHHFAAEIINASQNSSKEVSRELQVKYNEILLELKALGQSSKELKKEVEVIAVEQPTENIGVYHISFTERILSKLREIREDVDEGVAWFKALRNKNAARQYGAMAKKGGTSFTLSNERNVATQSG